MTLTRAFPKHLWLPVLRSKLQASATAPLHSMLESLHPPCAFNHHSCARSHQHPLSRWRPPKSSTSLRMGMSCYCAASKSVKGKCQSLRVEHRHSAHRTSTQHWPPRELSHHELWFASIQDAPRAEVHGRHCAGDLVDSRDTAARGQSRTHVSTVQHLPHAQRPHCTARSAIPRELR